MWYDKYSCVYVHITSVAQMRVCENFSFMTLVAVIYYTFLSTCLSVLDSQYTYIYVFSCVGVLAQELVQDAVDRMLVGKDPLKAPKRTLRVYDPPETLKIDVPDDDKDFGLDPCDKSHAAMATYIQRIQPNTLTWAFDRQLILPKPLNVPSVNQKFGVDQAKTIHTKESNEVQETIATELRSMIDGEEQKITRLMIAKEEKVKKLIANAQVFCMKRDGGKEDG